MSVSDYLLVLFPCTWRAWIFFHYKANYFLVFASFLNLVHILLSWSSLMLHPSISPSIKVVNHLEFHNKWPTIPLFLSQLFLTVFSYLPFLSILSRLSLSLSMVSTVFFNNTTPQRPQAFSYRFLIRSTSVRLKVRILKMKFFTKCFLVYRETSTNYLISTNFTSWRMLPWLPLFYYLCLSYICHQSYRTPQIFKSSNLQ